MGSMKRSIFGWFSSSSIITAAATLTVITGVAFASGGAMFNPGSLSSKPGAPLLGVTSHSEIQQCSDCHATPWGTETMADKCLACHADIKTQLTQPNSLHGLIVDPKTGLDCRSCHTEHHGPTAALTRIAPGWDPHDKLGFSLNKHRLRMDGSLFECKDCHRNGYTKPFDQVACSECHAQVNQKFTQTHTATFGADCMACHDGIDSHGASFNHNAVPFNLIGVHKITACSKCHDGARNIPDLQATKQECIDCHAKDDAHQGQFGDKCAICHTADGWQKSAQFDHDLAKFKLTGKHVKVTCDLCHVNNEYQGIPQDCFACHQKDDKHAGKFGTDCAACHTTDGWNRATDHSQFAFHLDGAHANVACESCHLNGVFKGTPSDCVSCHAKDDAHKGKLGTQCDSCHTVKDWTSASFDHNTVKFVLTAHQTKSDGSAFGCKDCHVKDYASPFNQTTCATCHLQVNKTFTQGHTLAFGVDCMACHDGVDSHGAKFDHNKVPFALVGKHATATCAKCHFNDRTIADMQAAPQDCFTCHQKDDKHKGQLGKNCQSCHTPEAWKPANINHATFAFHLDGKHATVACESCHVGGVYKGTPQDCASCHSKNDPHKGQLGTACQSCHTPAAWKPANVDHATFVFKLEGKHNAVACTSCHAGGVFKETPQDCASCHAKSDPHQGKLGTTCQSCHTPAAWKPANINHATFVFKLEGKHSAVACASCHKDLLFKETPQDCASCHAKDDAHAGSFGTNCASCHSTAGWQLAKVDHSKFAFHLDGKHGSVACQNCHAGGVFKGTPSDCASCHTKNDPHKGQLGTACQSCHTPAAWKPANVDHATFVFKLEGKHNAVACTSCHAGGVFKETPQDCASCHAKSDPHQGKLGTTCQSCHTPAAWKPANIDHSKFAFTLDGKHGSVACASCHADQLFKGTPSDCATCHSKVDPHQGKLGTACQACHTPAAWKPSVFNHNNAAFHLDGKHATAACASCHKDQIFKGTPSDCVSCHAKDDGHAGRMGTKCETCHVPNGWSPANFDHNTVPFVLTAHQKKSDGSPFACKDCHTNGYAAAFDQTSCATCHTQINATFANAHIAAFGTSCESCHDGVDSRGAKFDHNTVAFALAGKHAPVACSKCHTGARSIHDLQATSPDCVACHAPSDKHQGQFGTNCASCHSPQGWELARVDHSTFAFHLDGKHAAVACETCHAGGIFKETPTDCVACHSKNDPHGGSLGTQCAVCHVPVAWKPSTFNHANSAFALTGLHSSAACASCHVNGVFKGTPKDCASCHTKNDPHGGNLGTNCASCHATTGWKPSTFNHGVSVFALTGKHTAVACTSCHQGGVFKGTPQDCASCHTKNDPHGGNLGTNCASCHVTDAWKPSTFNHGVAAFQLTGKHIAVACTSCHKGGVLKGTPTDCASCHINRDPHGGKLGTNCASCHVADAWAPSTFNHSNAPFHLDGKHATVACASCHADKIFVNTPTDCTTCHLKNDPHGGALGTQCVTCHNTNGWKPSLFNHANSIFQLTGKHTSVVCGKCHTDLKFKGTPTTCYACHAKNDRHGGKYGTNCQACHSTTGWRPATFNHALSAFPLTGKHTSTACASCHVNNVFAGTPKDCYACHAKNDRHGGKYGTNCASCHSTTAWKPATFDHSKMFALTGAHITVSCAACHPNGRYAGTPTACIGCHSDPVFHAGAFGTNCASCHSTSAWSPAKFGLSHPRIDGGEGGSGVNHGGATCRNCHPSTVHQATCTACHGSNNPGGGDGGD